jgi:hypothetical protein
VSPPGVEITGHGGPPDPAAALAMMTQEMERGMTRAVLIVEAEWKRRIAHRTGDTRRRATHRVVRVGRKVLGILGGDSPVLRWGEFGTGLYGPRNRWIVPKKPGGVLRFPQPGNAGFTLAGRVRSGAAGAGAQFVYARRVRGMRPRRWLRDAIVVTEGRVQREFDLTAQRIAARLAQMSGGR